MQFQSNFDEFGRDITLKTNKGLVLPSCLLRFKGISWAEIDYILEEEQEEKEKEEKRKNLIKIHEERKIQVIQGDYELEEGEEL